MRRPPAACGRSARAAPRRSARRCAAAGWRARWRRRRGTCSPARRCQEISHPPTGSACPSQPPGLRVGSAPQTAAAGRRRSRPRRDPRWAARRRARRGARISPPDSLHVGVEHVAPRPAAHRHDRVVPHQPGEGGAQGGLRQRGGRVRPAVGLRRDVLEHVLRAEPRRCRNHQPHAQHRLGRRAQPVVVRARKLVAPPVHPRPARRAHRSGRAAGGWLARPSSRRGRLLALTAPPARQVRTVLQRCQLRRRLVVAPHSRAAGAAASRGSAAVARLGSARDGSAVVRVGSLRRQ
eukprot:scaffold1411_cov125-Isochrysis_galbana.AAC.2